MAVIKPFKGIRPAQDKVHLVASRAVDSYDPLQLHAKLSENPYTFLHVIKPEFGTGEKNKTNSPVLLKKIKEKFLAYIKEGILVNDKEECFYIYQQLKEDHTFTGIIACASVEDYFNNVIKKHEQTIAEREEKLKDYLEICDFNAEPVCFSYPDNPAINTLVSRIISEEYTCNFTTTDRVGHKLWKLSDRKIIDEIVSVFATMPAVYIADGHHRCSSSALLGKTMKEKNPNHNGTEPYNFFMASFFPESNLKIYEFNRIVKDLNGLSANSFLKNISKHFIVEEKGSLSFKPETKNVFGMYLEKKWFSLRLKEKNDKLDTELLSDLILSPILDIQDLRRDKRITFISGTKGIDGLKKIIDSGKGTVGFLLYPVTMHDVVKIADAGGTMPPKSTWVEPKLRNGLVIYSLSNTNS